MLTRFLFDPDPNAAFILKGYAGTGKTSLVSALIQSAPQLKIKTLLLAPTGRAAKVLSAYSGRQAFTIHKKIYTTVLDGFGAPHCVRAMNKHAYTLFIVDEASMIGLEGMDESFAGNRSLLEDLIEYVAEGMHCRLLFIGDTAQLPPVGQPESPALSAEYLASLAPLKLFEYELTEVVRQESLSGILANATALRRQLAQMEEWDEVQMPLFEVRPDVIRLHGSDLEDALNSEYSAGGQEDVVLITRSNRTANLYNQAVRYRCLGHDNEVATGDYLMVVRNNYFWLESDREEGFIANGDIVEVLRLRNHQELYGFHFVDATLRFIDYPTMPHLDCKLLLETLHSESPSLTRDERQLLFQEVMKDYADLPTKAERMEAMRKDPYYNALQVKFAYALTCHKTQGGQWPVVFVDQGYLTDDMLTREYLRWLYTALTRATQRVYLLNFQERFFAPC